MTEGDSAASSPSTGLAQIPLSELIERRQALQVTLASHEASLREFWPEGRPYFVIQTAELCGLAQDDGKSRPRHITSSASCLESLADLRPGLRGAFPHTSDGSASWRHHAAEFARRALAAPAQEWTSDEAAHVYCRVRALPAILRYAPVMGSGSPLFEAARTRLREAFAVIDADRPLVEQGLGERVLDENGVPESERPGERYPANTFHAYWGLKANRRYVMRARASCDVPALDAEHLSRVRQNEAWAQAAMGRHTALLDAGKRRGDAQQLAFAILADLLAQDRRLTPASAQHDMYEAGLRAFFSAQEPVGNWPRSLPLFHYPISGNAYCYTFETLTELLRPALPRDAGRAYRALLEPYLSQLFRAWDYAVHTRVPLSDEHGDTFGWSSTHHVGRDSPEAWATAEVFSFGQMLRCLTGHVVAERAGEELGARRPDYPGRRVAERELAERGDTWAADGWTVGRQLASLFLHPARMPDRRSLDEGKRDPDAAVIGKEHARSAVLFGPPGTGKTTLVEALAGALGWEYVEVLASDFLRQGVDGVPAQADRIFDLLMQLDRCVVLFDEIDELIQDRSSQESDPFGRFLTTSMLPKIAKLWKQRRVLFFVATNHVSRADPAITRTSRFDARIFVAPPGLAVKRRELLKPLGSEAPALEADKITAALSTDSKVRDHLSKTAQPLGILPLLRFDQVPELARRLRHSGEPSTEESLVAALEQMGVDLLHHEWQPASPPEDFGSDDWTTADRLRFVLHEYLSDESRDFAKSRLARIDVPEGQIPLDWPVHHSDAASGAADETFLEAPDELAALLDVNGEVSLDGGSITDQHLLHFARSDIETADAEAEVTSCGEDAAGPGKPEGGQA